MTGQHCGRCGEPRTPAGCACGWADGPGGNDEETAVIPVVGGPELVRPYFRPGDAQGAEQDPLEVEVLDAEVLDSTTVLRTVAPHSAHSPSGSPGSPGSPSSPGFSGPTASPPGGYGPAAAQTRVLPAHLGAHLPAQRPAEQLGSLVVTGGRGGAGSGRRRRPSRGAVLIGAGIAVIAGIGVAAALVPQLLGGGPVDVSLPQPGVTAPLPTQSSVSAEPSSAVSATRTHPAPVVRPTRTAPPSSPPASARTSAPPTAAPTTAAPTGSAPPASASGAPTATASPDSTAAAGGDGSLSLGDSGPAVVTLQQELSDLYIDPDLDANGTYGRRTENDVATFQMWYGVEGDPTGVFGPNSQARMDQLMNQQGDDGGDDDQ
ncbi:peptidoglycan-binding protein [Streptacidiphilus sp. PB12-B1b]|uniref:peptidoglycan-binding protein n=1 Tax=Streptacidiphilus sp. PB12-B1b TaxID=2705012 RepID=UPI0015FB79A3|nr:peptidoglycan-binding protein [Streptacidiphilus sp. PB12-B1b]QMU75666.1 peptidoglycan-binding protein [Streptacidiphilus sp. PB12-B1b]